VRSPQHWLSAAVVVLAGAVVAWHVWRSDPACALQWFVGIIAIAAITGWACTGLLHDYSAHVWGMRSEPDGCETERRLPPAVTGVVERVIFAMLVAVTGAAVPQWEAGSC
jgi:hypothetical protein